MTPALDLAVRHRRGAFALDARFQAPAGLTALFGRSGAGKSTIVDIIAGLIRPEQGRIAVGGETLLDTARAIALPPHRRRLGYVFQDARLFPHLSVRSNLGFGRWFAPDRLAASEVDRVIDLLGIGHLLKRRPGGLSGGERQRVAIGRALLSNPRLLLMDEPLASLDEPRKAEILPYIERLRDEAGIPIVYVSHAIAEVARLATTIVLIEDGRVTAAGPASRILIGMDGAVSPAVDRGALIDAIVVRHDPGDGLSMLETAAGPLVVPRLASPPGARVRVRIAPRDVTLAIDRPERISTLNILPGLVRTVGTGDGSGTCLVALACGEAEILACITCRSAAALNLGPGVAVHALVKGVAVEAS